MEIISFRHLRDEIGPRNGTVREEGGRRGREGGSLYIIISNNKATLVNDGNTTIISFHNVRDQIGPRNGESERVCMCVRVKECVCVRE